MWFGFAAAKVLASSELPRNRRSETLVKGGTEHRVLTLIEYRPTIGFGQLRR